jgi:hypothetical protein
MPQGRIKPTAFLSRIIMLCFTICVADKLISFQSIYALHLSHYLNFKSPHTICCLYGENIKTRIKFSKVER